MIDDPAPAVQLGAKIGSAAAKVILSTRKYDPATGKFGDGSKAQPGMQSLSTSALHGFVQRAYREAGLGHRSQPASGGARRTLDEVMPFVLADPHLPPGPKFERKFKNLAEAEVVKRAEPHLARHPLAV
ncbi:hypothetical protein ACWAT4_07455 [Bradyrhizobium manausense]